MSASRVASAILAILASILVVAPVGLWSAMALWFRLPAPDAVRGAAACLAAVAAIATMIALFTRVRWRALGAFALAFVGLLAWWSTILPPAGGDWAPDVARQTTGTVDGDVLTLSDVRDFDWRSDSDFTERWGARSYDLGKLSGLDLFLSYWAGPQMAHLIMSFDFDDGQVLAWSMEVRREKTGVYSPVADAFRSHTLVSLATTERDRSASGRTSAAKTSASTDCALRPQRFVRFFWATWTKPTRSSASPGGTIPSPPTARPPSRG